MNKEQIKETIITTSFLVAILAFSLYTGYKAETTITTLQEENYRLKLENTHMKSYIIDNEMNYTEEVIK